MTGSIPDAVWHAPGRCCAVVVYKAGSLAPAELRERVASLMKFFEREREKPRARLVAALSPAVLAGVEGFEDRSQGAFPGEGPGKKAYVRTGGDVLFQLSSESDVSLRRALRIVSEVMGAQGQDRGTVEFAIEVSGGRIFSGEEPFGFHEGKPDAAQRAAVLGAIARPGGWLLFQLYRQDVAGFFRQESSAEKRAAVLGKAALARPIDETDTEADRLAATTDRTKARELTAHASSHWGRMRPSGEPLGMVRRGFPCRTGGSDGLAFVAVAPDPVTFQTALGHMQRIANSEQDRLLKYITPVAGDVFFLPSDPAWLASSAPDLKTPVSAKQIDRRVPLADYMVVQAFLEYLMELRRHGLFDNRDLPTRVSDVARGPLDALYESLAQTSSGTSAHDLRELERRVIANAVLLNGETDEYISFG